MEKEIKKYCPLSFNRDSSIRGYQHCVKKYCAWWNDIDSCCSMVVLSNAAINLAEMAVGQRIIYTKEV